MENQKPMRPCPWEVGFPRMNGRANDNHRDDQQPGENVLQLACVFR